MGWRLAEAKRVCWAQMNSGFTVEKNNKDDLCNVNSN